MRRTIKRLLILLIAFFLLLTTGCNNKNDYEAKDYILELDYKDDFKILQLTDIHMANKDDRQREFDFIKETIDMANPDLIIITGDSFTFATRTVANEFIDFFENCQIPWAITWGNHDEQCYFSIDWLTGKLNKLSEKEDSYCVFVDYQDDNVTGNANYAINLNKDDKVHTQLIVMDSNRYNYGEYIGYDYFKQDQMDWYCDIVDYTTGNNSGVEVPSLMFFHIPLPEWEEAWNAAQEGTADLIIGEKREGFAVPKINSGFYQVIKDKHSTIGMFAGHDHLNDFVVKYDNMYFGYGVTATDRIYFDEDMLGGLVITIHDDNTLDFSEIIRSYEEYK